MSTLHHLLAQKGGSDARLSEEEALLLLKTRGAHEISQITAWADLLRQKRVGNQVRFASTLYLHPTNLCTLSCALCSFYAKPGSGKEWFVTPEEMALRLCQDDLDQFTEIHVVGGLWPSCTLDYYEEIFSHIRTLAPHLHIKALTPVEVAFLAQLHHLSTGTVLDRLQAWGVSSLTGGGAEILVDTLRQKIAHGKLSSEAYLAIHEEAHRRGLSSNITMLFGHLEREEDVVTHLKKVRDLQDKTGGFSCFVPLQFDPKNTALGRHPERLKQWELPLLYAVSRLFLDNILDLKVLWNYVGVDAGLHLLCCGGNDFSSTNTEEKISGRPGRAAAPMDAETLSFLIQSLGRVPYLTHSGARSCCVPH